MSRRDWKRKNINKNSIKIDINFGHFKRAPRGEKYIYCVRNRIDSFNFNGAVKNDHQQINERSNIWDLCAERHEIGLGSILVSSVGSFSKRICLQKLPIICQGI